MLAKNTKESEISPTKLQYFGDVDQANIKVFKSKIMRLFETIEQQKRHIFKI